MAVSGNQLTRIGASLLSIAKRLLISAKSEASVSVWPTGKKHLIHINQITCEPINQQRHILHIGSKEAREL